MQNITINYIPGLGDYLDENKLDWNNNGDDTVTISFNSLEDIFQHGYKFREFRESLEKE